jgi:hypothetical protein
MAQPCWFEYSNEFCQRVCLLGDRGASRSPGHITDNITVPNAMIDFEIPVRFRNGPNFPLHRHQNPLPHTQAGGLSNYKNNAARQAIPAAGAKRFFPPVLQPGSEPD